jgi:cation diffusion facilitator CzcD-associated flavoprotein CzcO
MAEIPNLPTEAEAPRVEPLTVPNGMTNSTTHTNGVNGSSNDITTDVLIIGGGFGGMYGLHQLRQLGLSVSLFEAGSDFGGTWHWNRYPGARVDSETPFYSLSIPEVYKDWTFSERYPDHAELRRYFKHVDKVLNLKKDAHFNTIVVEAEYFPEEGRWHVRTEDGRLAKARYLISATGSSYKKHFPNFKNLDSYRGKLVHSAAYPETGLDFKNKKVAVIGSGATGVQLVQEIAQENCELTAFVRTPNVSIPMRQRKLTKEEQDSMKSYYHSLYYSAKTSRTGFPYHSAAKSYHETTPEERLAYYEELWKRGGFSFLLSCYPEFFVDKALNREIYQFWAGKTRDRIKDSFKREVMAPMEQPHWLGTKRGSLEQNYYEMVDRDNVTVVDLKRTPIVEFEEKGIRTSERLLEFDIIIFATGYDALTGSLKDIGLIGTDGVPLKERWSKGTHTYLGLSIPKFPNFFMVYSPQAPTPLANGPAIIELQVEWITNAIRKMEQTGIKYIDAQQSFAERWREDIQQFSNATLFAESQSWYMG